jgi:hypothetical protein
VIVEIKKIKTEYTRLSKSGKSHAYTRYKKVAVLRCDRCSVLFERAVGNMDKKRASNDYKHVCANCNPKQFAQTVGVKNRNFWNMPVDTDIDITKF